MNVSRRHLGKLLLAMPLAVCALPAGAQRMTILVDVPAIFGRSPSLLVRKFGKATVDPDDKAVQVFRKPGMEIRATVVGGKVREMEISLDKQERVSSQQWLRRFNLKLRPV